MENKIYGVEREMYENDWMLIGGEDELFTKKEDAEKLMRYHRRDGGKYRVVEIQKGA